MLRLDKITKIYPNGEALRDVTWEVKPGERIGLVGANGSGKTTQFKIITGEIEATSGDVFKPHGSRIAYLTQEFDIQQDATVRDELLAAFKEAHDIKVALHHVQKQLETATPENIDSLLHKLDRLQRQFENADGYGLERRVDIILPEIGFSTEDGDRLVSTFSGGWQMRIGFGKVMLREPDVLLLDEPTNHIDLETIEWLESYLMKQTIPMVIVSHDRRFLDKLCTKIVEIERGESSNYLGNYSAYIEQKEQTRTAQLSAYERQQEELQKQQAFIDRFRASATRSTQAKSREKQLEKWELIDEPEGGLKTLKFWFPEGVASGKLVVEIKNMAHGYDDNILFLDANLTIQRGDRIAFVGPNGSGKSTLLRLITGQEAPMDGVCQLGQHNIVPAYFEQNQAEALELDISVLDTIADCVHNWKDAEIRGLLGRFLFSGDTVFKKVRDLSGGEKARLALAKMLTTSANFLILDEPTNHLDIPAKETLEEALKEYEGTVIIVSHDRYFISQVATKIVELRDSTLVEYHGDYKYYEQKKEEEKQRALDAKVAKQREEEQAAKRAKQRDKEKLKKEKQRNG
ncbi:MAG TPA: ATP-binding cassette domain-containing protein [Planktothrix sp.]|jgi:ATP-binding cassette subfamily F protein 3